MSGWGRANYERQYPMNPNNRTAMSGGQIGGMEQSTSFQDPDTVWGGQAPYLQGMYGGAANLAGNFSQYQGQAQNIQDSAMQAYAQMMNPGINPQLNAYSGEVQRNLEDNLLPTVQGNAAGFGQMGGSRQGVAEGLALSRANQQITDMASNLYNDDMNRMMGAMGMSGQMMQQQMGIPWYALNQLSGILGRPTVLGGAQGSQSSGANWGSDWSREVDIGGGGGGGYGWGIAGGGGVTPSGGS